MDHIEKLEAIRDILVKSLGDVDPHGLVAEMDDLLRRIKPLPTDYEVVSKDAEEWIDNVSKNIPNNISKEEILSRIKSSFTIIESKKYPMTVKEIDALSEKTKKEQDYKVQLKKLYRKYNEEKEKALANLSYKYRLISFA